MSSSTRIAASRLATVLAPPSVSDRPDNFCTPDMSGTSVRGTVVLACGASSSIHASCKPCTRNGGGTTPAQGTPRREATHCYRRHIWRGCELEALRASRNQHTGGLLSLPGRKYHQDGIQTYQAQPQYLMQAWHSSDAVAPAADQGCCRLTQRQ